MYSWIIILFLSVVVKSDVPNVDVTLFDKTPLVDIVGTSSTTKYSAYVAWHHRFASYTIGRAGYTGTGHVGSGFHPRIETGHWYSVPGEHGFPTGTETRFHQPEELQRYERMDIQIPGNSLQAKVGVFYVTTFFNGFNVSLSTIRMSQTAKIKPNRFSYTASIGDTVVLETNTTVPELRWIHNDGLILEKWDGQNSLEITNVRLADAGIYECFEKDKREDGVHSIMILIVRACPGPKFGVNCTQNCPTCWNGGKCDPGTGKCVCPPGFKGTHCEKSCGSNNWGAECNIYCCKRFTDKCPGNCKGALMRPPDPIGITCIAGFTGLECTEECMNGMYGANCDLHCNCEDDCDAAKGCTGSTCKAGFGGTYCTESENSTCSAGLFGRQCEFQCHCLEGDSCNKTTGACDNRCATGWAGIDCHQALPVLADPPIIEEVDGLVFRLLWNQWSRTRDYGVGPGETYQMSCWENNHSKNRAGAITTRITTTNITFSKPETSYICRVSVFKLFGDNEMLPGPMGPAVTGRTQCGSPLKSPVFENDYEIESYSVVLEWHIPKDRKHWIQCSEGLKGFLMTYEKHGSPNDTNKIDIASDEREVTINNLFPCTTYIFGIAAYNNYSAGPNDFINVTTSSIAPETPESLEIVQVSSTLINVSWKEPTYQCGLTHYLVSYGLINLDQCNGDIGQQKEASVRSMVTSANLTDLMAYSTYQISVAAAYADIVGNPAASKPFITYTSVPTGVPTNVKAGRSTQGLISFSWDKPLCGYRKGAIDFYEYQFGPSLQLSESEGTQINSSFVTLNVTDHYEFRVAAHTSAGRGPYSEVLKEATTTSSSSEASSKSVYVVITFGVLFLLALIVTLVIIRKKRSDKNKRTEATANSSDGHLDSGVSVLSSSATVDANTVAVHPLISKAVVRSTTRTLVARDEENLNAVFDDSDNVDHDVHILYGNVNDSSNAEVQGRYKPNLQTLVAVKDLIKTVKGRKRNHPDHMLKAEHRSLSDVEPPPATIAAKRINAKKNRYRDIVTYDHSRVILDSDSYSDYINASYIDGYNKPGYIATQGPNQATVVDMWRMIWQENCRSVVMATELKEGMKRKCEQYWPNEGESVKYGDFEIVNKEEMKNDDYTIRTFLLSTTQVGRQDVREVKHFQYTAWPDMSVPQFASSVLRLLDEVNSYNPQDAGPIVVHCSAGVGRTGTFLAIDTMRKMAKTEHRVDILGYATYMRAQRPSMIQTEDQYVFVYEALLESLFCGQTDFVAADADEKIGELINNDNLVRRQLQCLQSMHPDIPADRCVGGKSLENVSKNRYKNSIPPDSSRPYLMSTDENNYINATYCDSHSRKGMFLATQVPLPNTVNDFWSMVYDYKCAVIVTLNDPYSTDKTCADFYPTGGSITCCTYRIELLSKHECDNNCIWKLKLIKTTKHADEMTITLIQYKEWPVGSKLPKSPQSFLTLLNLYGMSWYDDGHKRTAVICMNGVDRCGVFCAMASIINQIKLAQKISVFHTVKRLKKSTDTMVNCLEQYKFCYETTRLHMESFATYANFK